MQNKSETPANVEDVGQPKREASLAAPNGYAPEDWSGLHEPCDAPNRRAHFERTERFNAFHDGLNTPEIQAAIARARDKALAQIKARKAHTDKLSDGGHKTL